MLIQNLKSKQTKGTTRYSGSYYDCSPQGTEEETCHRFKASLGYRVKSCREEEGKKPKTKNNETKTTCLIQLLCPQTINK